MNIREISKPVTAKSLNESLAKKIATRNDYDKTIAECETAYRKVKIVQ